MKKGQVYDFCVEDTEFPGTGIAVADGIKVYIKNAIEGQKVKARIFKKKRNMLKQSLLK